MKIPVQFQKWGKIALATLCALLIFKLVAEIKGNPAPADGPDQTVSHPPPKPESPVKSEPGKGNAVVRLDSMLQLQPLEEFVPKPLPNIGRNPFDFGPPPLTPAQRAAAQAAIAASAASSASSAPGIPLRAIGYGERVGIGPEAYLTDSDQVYIVHDGDVVSRRFRIVRITSSIVEVLDNASGEKSRLLIPAVQ